MKSHFDLLGRKVKDKVTGAEGIVDSICFDLYGCVQATMNTGFDKEGKRKDSYWFDVKRLEVLTKKPVMEVPDFSLPEIGAADKPTPDNL